MNISNFRKVLAHIEAHPEQWDQCIWNSLSVCGTAFCFAGHAEAIAGFKPVPDPDVDSQETTWYRAARWLGIEPNSRTESWLFDAFRTLDDFRRVSLIYGGAP